MQNLHTTSQTPPHHYNKTITIPITINSHKHYHYLPSHYTQHGTTAPLHSTPQHCLTQHCSLRLWQGKLRFSISMSLEHAGQNSSPKTQGRGGTLTPDTRRLWKSQFVLGRPSWSLVSGGRRTLGLWWTVTKSLFSRQSQDNAYLPLSNLAIQNRGLRVKSSDEDEGLMHTYVYAHSFA